MKTFLTVTGLFLCLLAYNQCSNCPPLALKNDVTVKGKFILTNNGTYAQMMEATPSKGLFWQTSDSLHLYWGNGSIWIALDGASAGGNSVEIEGIPAAGQVAKFTGTNTLTSDSSIKITETATEINKSNDDGTLRAIVRGANIGTQAFSSLHTYKVVGGSSPSASISCSWTTYPFITFHCSNTTGTGNNYASMTMDSLGLKMYDTLFLDYLKRTGENFQPLTVTSSGGVYGDMARVNSSFALDMKLPNYWLSYFDRKNGEWNWYYQDDETGEIIKVRGLDGLSPNKKYQTLMSGIEHNRRYLFGVKLDILFIEILLLIILFIQFKRA
jgi:hypothetical protein